MTGTTTEGILVGKPEEEQRKRKNSNVEMWRWTNQMDGWIIDQIPGGTRVYRREGGRLQGCNRKEHQNLGGNGRKGWSAVIATQEVNEMSVNSGSVSWSRTHLGGCIHEQVGCWCTELWGWRGLVEVWQQGPVGSAPRWGAALATHTHTHRVHISAVTWCWIISGRL